MAFEYPDNPGHKLSIGPYCTLHNRIPFIFNVKSGELGRYLCTTH